MDYESAHITGIPPAFAGYAVKYAYRIFRDYRFYNSYHSVADLTSEAVIVYLKVKDRYPHAEDRLLMSMFKTALYRHYIGMARICDKERAANKSLKDNPSIAWEDVALKAKPAVSAGYVYKRIACVKCGKTANDSPEMLCYRCRAKVKRRLRPRNATTPKSKLKSKRVGGYKMSKASRRNMSRARAKHPLSEDARNRISIAQKERWAKMSAEERTQNTEKARAAFDSSGNTYMKDWYKKLSAKERGAFGKKVTAGKIKKKFCGATFCAP